MDDKDDSLSSNIFAKYAFQGTPEKKTQNIVLGKRKSTTNAEAIRGSPRRKVGDARALKVEEEGAQELMKSESPTPGSSKASKKVKMYHHLKEIDDHLEDNLDIVFCGIKYGLTQNILPAIDAIFSPGEQSAQIGHHYGNPTNHFWSCLHASGLTPRRYDPREDSELPKACSIGLTNLVDRPSVEQSELSKAEQVAGVSKLLQKIAHFKPRVVCFVGLGIAEVVRANCGLPVAPKTPKVKAEVGIQSYKMVHEHRQETVFFAVSSTSGRVVRYTKTHKIEQFKQLRELLVKIKNEEYDTAHLHPIRVPPPDN